MLDGPLIFTGEVVCGPYNGQFPLRELLAGNHGSCIHQDKYLVQDYEYNY